LRETLRLCCKVVGADTEGAVSKVRGGNFEVFGDVGGVGVEVEVEVEVWRNNNMEERKDLLSLESEWTKEDQKDFRSLGLAGQVRQDKARQGKGGSVCVEGGRDVAPGTPVAQWWPGCGTLKQTATASNFVLAWRLRHQVFDRLGLAVLPKGLCQRRFSPVLTLPCRGHLQLSRWMDATKGSGRSEVRGVRGYSVLSIMFSMLVREEMYSVRESHIHCHCHLLIYLT
jgi:hypothetical protein